MIYPILLLLHNLRLVDTAEPRWSFLFLLYSSLFTIKSHLLIILLLHCRAEPFLAWLCRRGLETRRPQSLLECGRLDNGFVFQITTIICVVVLRTRIGILLSCTISPLANARSSSIFRQRSTKQVRGASPLPPQVFWLKANDLSTIFVNKSFFRPACAIALGSFHLIVV